MGSEDTSNPATVTASQENIPRKRSFASKLNTVRTYKEIPKEDLLSGDAIKQTITPRGRPLGFASPTKEKEEEAPESPMSPVSPVAPDKPNNVEATAVESSPQPLNGSAAEVNVNVAASPESPSSQGRLNISSLKPSIKKTPSAGSLKYKTIGWAEAKNEKIEIPSVKYLEKLELENTKMKIKLETLEKESQQIEAIKKERDDAKEELRLKMSAQENTQETIKAANKQIAELQATIEALKSRPDTSAMEEQTNLRELLDKALQESQQLEAIKKERDDAKEELRLKMSAQENTLQQAQAAINSAYKQTAELHETIEALKSRPDASVLEEENKKLQARLDKALKELEDQRLQTSDNNSEKVSTRDWGNPTETERARTQPKSTMSEPLYKLKSLFYTQVVLWILVMALLFTIFFQHVENTMEKAP